MCNIDHQKNPIYREYEKLPNGDIKEKLWQYEERIHKKNVLKSQKIEIEGQKVKKQNHLDKINKLLEMK